MVIACLRELCSCCFPDGDSDPVSQETPSTMAPPATTAGGDDQNTDTTITHRTVEVGTGVLLLHGFPELWYTWRHQMRALAAAGYRAVAPDLRGYGGSDAPAPAPDAAGQYTALHVVGDLVGLIDALGEKRVFVAAHDWGALTAWSLCLRPPPPPPPDRVRALAALSVAYRPVDGLRALFGDDYYICRIQEPGAIEAEFGCLGTELVLRKFLSYRSPGPLFIPKSGWGSPDDEVPLPSWVTEEDLKYYSNNKMGAFYALRTWELTSPWTGAEINVPVKFIIGDLDLTYHSPGIQDFIHKGSFKKFVPLLDDVVVMKDVGHFINEEKPKEVSEHIISFIKKFN
ncbi:bifunctional epoxide hydrolase 2-like [Panicum miliaceum]|uniref:Bifunctional epoxide hydrolase 2-like n=1 Tax=Panicum miliaceum TaxID=4540 RepID=A0A3L6T2G2_PANMI|nr:bifunctional epoxide hydrolase 2-like [Panicum miliaceum]